MTYQVAAGAEAFVVGGAWPDFRLERFTTKQLNIFTAEQMLIDPRGISGKHVPSSQTKGGEYARLGFYAFRANGRDVMVHESKIKLVEGPADGKPT